MRFAKAFLLFVFFNLVIVCHAQTRITGGYVLVLSDADYQTAPLIRTSINLLGSGLQTNANISANGAAQIFTSGRPVSNYSYRVAPDREARGYIYLGGLTCPNGYLSNANSTESTRLHFSVADFYIPKFYRTQKTLMLVSPFTLTGRISCFGSGTDANPPYGTRLIEGSGNARFIFTRVQNTNGSSPNRTPLYLTTVQYEFVNSSLIDE